MAGRPSFDDYVDVSERISMFYEKYPEGSLEAEVFELSDSRVVMRAYAYRSQDDRRPGVGWASGAIPGPTPFTKGSEVENCETSAWGRAIASLGFEVRRGIATKQEVESKTRGTRNQQPEAPSGHLLDEALKQGAKLICEEHKAEWIDNKKTGKRGHIIEGTSEYHVEEIPSG